MSDNSVKDDGTIWEHARAYSNLLGGVPSSFSTAIRGLKSDADKGQSLSKGTIFQASRLTNSPSLGAGFLFAAKTFFQEEVQKRGNLTGKDFLELFPPLTLASLIGISYFYKKAKSLAVADEWPHYTKSIHNTTDLAGFIGVHIPRVGLGRGLLLGAMDTIALTCFHLHDKKGFTEYRRILKTKNIREDLDHERDRWGCTRYHVAGILIQALGFGVDFSNAYSVGITSDNSAERLLSPEAYTFRIARVWLEALEATGQAPDRAMRVEYYPDTAGLGKIQQAASSIKDSGSQFCWLDKTKEEVLQEVHDDTPPPQEES